MAKYEVTYVRQETLYTRYYVTVEAESAEAACEKVWEYSMTDEEAATIVEGKCIGIEDSHLDNVEGARKLEEKDDEK